MSRPGRVAVSALLLITSAGCGRAAPPSPSAVAETTPQAIAAASATPDLAPTPSPTPSPVPTPIATPMPWPLPGDLLIADRGNGRLLIVDPAKRIVWSTRLDRSAGWTGPALAADDAFFTPDGRAIAINAESQDVVARVDLASRRITWSYGHALVPGAAPGYLNTPDDAYPLANGDTLVADIRNERVLEIAPNGRIVRQLGRTGVRRHAPPAEFASPNGDTPLPDGGILVTEIGGSWVDRIDAAGHLVWSLHLSGIYYPSDAQLLPNGDVLVVDYHAPGRIEEVRPNGHVVWDYHVVAGSGMLNHPSLAIRLPNGLVAVTDDDNERVVVIDPATNRIVWQYGHTGVAGSAPGYLNGPDGLDLAGPGVVLPGG
jgi:outer membrane protein assembly factor BamB